MEAYFKTKQKRQKNSGEQEKESIILVRVGSKNLSLRITICHHSASLVMPNGDPRDIFFYSTITLMIDSYILPVMPSCLLLFLDIAYIANNMDPDQTALIVCNVTHRAS